MANSNSQIITEQTPNERGRGIYRLAQVTDITQDIDFQSERGQRMTSIKTLTKRELNATKRTTSSDLT